MNNNYSIQLGRETFAFNTGYLAKQADGAVLVSSGENMVFASVVAAKDLVEGQDYFPLMVDYREKLYAAGLFPGGFIKRETRPSDRETLTSRLADRPLRPLFPEDFMNEVQIIIYVMSSDGMTQPDVLAINAASGALTVSGIPFNGPVGAVRVGRIDGQFVLNPTFDEAEKSEIDLVVAGTVKAVTMIEGLAQNVSEETMISAVEFAHENIKKICACQEEMRAKCGKPTIGYTPVSADPELKKEIYDRYYGAVENLITIKDKKQREAAFEAIVKQAKQELADRFPNTIKQAQGIIDGIDYTVMRKRILDESARADGRKLTEIRPIDIMLGLLPRAHGSAVFTRGQTQSLGIVTLGTVADAQRVEALEGKSHKRFMLHYNFPPFSVGETGRVGGTGRREIGHGMLAERALSYAVPDEEKFPYTIRVVSEILESNGSSSMATVCSGSLAMFNAGVPLKSAVAGIAMGLVMEGGRYAILSDILGLEDHLGDMDFKVAGTATGITAFQLDIKIEGITTEIMRTALNQAREGRMHILGEMAKACPEPSMQLSPYVPKMKMFMIDPDKIGAVIGTGGKIIRGLIEECGADINIEDSGAVTVSSMSLDNIAMAEKKIRAIVEDIEVGKIYEGTVKKCTNFGAFVEIVPGKEGLLHVSNMDFKRVNKVSDLMKVGDIVPVMVTAVDRSGKIELNRKEALKVLGKKSDDHN